MGTAPAFASVSEALDMVQSMLSGHAGALTTGGNVTVNGGAGTNDALTVNYSIGGTASNGVASGGPAIGVGTSWRCRCRSLAPAAAPAL